ncbi:MAG: tRNA (adenosine(37)-N6)-dimethylallyltransferase MiaA [Chthonomonas sp.]|nr:tRNA (adenosine(37)-N6)-dimethylallyltransferase MiaA [Chthonomonas sp.]
MPTLVAIYGETGSGKSDLAERWASERSAVLINFDAFQMYRGFNIGTNKPADLAAYELIDHKDPTEQTGVGQFIREALPILEQAFAASRDVVMVGGTGLYARALLDQWSELKPAPTPELREQLEGKSREENLQHLKSLDPNAQVDELNPVRVRRALERALTPGESFQFSLPGFKIIKVAPQWLTEILDERIAQRAKTMLANGWIEETEHLLASGLTTACPAFRAIGYIPIARFLSGLLSASELETEIVSQTRRYAKRQRTWLRGEQGLQWESELDRAAWPGQME